MAAVAEVTREMTGDSWDSATDWQRLEQAATRWRADNAALTARIAEVVVLLGKVAPGLPKECVHRLFHGPDDVGQWVERRRREQLLGLTAGSLDITGD